MLFPQTIVAFAPIVAPFFTTVFWYSFFRLMALLGLMTFVKTMEGPKKTSSSQITPVYMETLFCTFTFFPRITSDETTTF